MNNHTPSPGQPKNQKKIQFFNLIFVYPREYCSDLHQIFRSWSHNQGINNGQQIFKKSYPLWGQHPPPYPHILNLAVSRPIMNRSQPNFQGSFPWLETKEQAKNIPKCVAPSWGNPIPHIITYLPISRRITKRFLRYFQELTYMLGDNDWPTNHLIYI